MMGGAERSRRYYATHRVEQAARVRRWRAANAERFREIQRANARRRRAADPEKFREAWRRRDRIKKRVKDARRKARRRGLLSTLTAAEWVVIIARFGGRCAYCGVASDSLEQDHVVPVALGGAHTAENIVPACRRCNASKGARARPYPLRDYDDVERALRPSR